MKLQCVTNSPQQIWFCKHCWVIFKHAGYKSLLSQRDGLVQCDEVPVCDKQPWPDLLLHSHQKLHTVIINAILQAELKLYGYFWLVENILTNGRTIMISNEQYSLMGQPLEYSLIPILD